MVFGWNAWKTIQAHSYAVKIDLNLPMQEILATLSKYPVSTRLSLNGTIVVGRDIAHAKLKELLDAGLPLPQYVKDHPIYYAGPAKTLDEWIRMWIYFNKMVAV